MSYELPESLEPDDEGQMAPRNEMVAAPAEEQAAKQVEDVIEQTAPEILKPLRQEIAKRVISTTLVSMVTVFVQGRQSQVKDLKDKRGE